MEEEILALGKAVLKGDIIAKPTAFGGSDITAFYRNILTFTQYLDAVKLTVRYVYLIAVPQCGTAVFRHLTALDITVGNVPEGVAQIKIAIFNFNTAALL